jgi:predicted AAA+ superfamily ATPase
MAHIRKRHAQEIAKKLLSFSPLVGIFGHRQVGKTTFLEKVSAVYCTFDDKETLLSAKHDAKTFLGKLNENPVGIDECQYVEDLFPALKEYVRVHKKPGQIILSGSVRFYSRSTIRESLTGRIVNVDLLPMTLTELSERSRSTLPLKLILKHKFSSDLNSNMPSSELRAHKKLIDTYLQAGGLPGVCFLRDERIRSGRLKDQLQLILDRDLRLVYPTTVPYVQILEYVQQLSKQEGQPIQSTVLRRLTGLAETTQKKLLHALESIFLIRLLPIEGDRKGLSVYFEDQAEHRFLHSEKLDPLRAFEGLIYRNLRASFNYEVGSDFQFFQYRAQPDVRIPFVVKTKDGHLGIIPILDSEPSQKDLRFARKFLQKYSPATVLMVTYGLGSTKVIEPRILQIPAERLLFE